jgi:flagellar biosynthesis protein FlgN
MDADTCRKQISQLLADESTLLARLEQQLRSEHELLVKNDIEALETTGNARQDTVARLLRLDDERRGICRLMGRGGDAAGMGELLGWCDPQGSLASAYAVCAEQVVQCRTQNDRNGALVTARLNKVSSMLGMLNISGNDARTYGASRTHSPGPQRAGRLVATSA